MPPAIAWPGGPHLDPRQLGLHQPHLPHNRQQLRGVDRVAKEVHLGGAGALGALLAAAL